MSSKRLSTDDFIALNGELGSAHENHISCFWVDGKNDIKLNYFIESGRMIISKEYADVFDDVVEDMESLKLILDARGIVTNM